MVLLVGGRCPALSLVTDSLDQFPERRHLTPASTYPPRSPWLGGALNPMSGIFLGPHGEAAAAAAVLIPPVSRSGGKTAAGSEKVRTGFGTGGRGGPGYSCGTGMPLLRLFLGIEFGASATDPQRGCLLYTSPSPRDS